MSDPAVALLAFAPAETLLVDLLAVSLTGVIYYTPVTDAAGTVLDFRFEYLNPAAQRMLRLPQHPTLTHRQQWPHSEAHGTFACHVDAYLTGEPRTFNVSYQADGYDNDYCLAARRSGHGLLVSFTDTADQPRTAVEMALRASQAREQAARAEAEAERQRFRDVLLHLPASVATFRGPDLVYDLVTPGYQQLFRSRHLLGLPLGEALPELRGQGILEKLERVYRTGEPHYDPEQETWVDVSDTGHPEQRYYTVSFHPLRDAHGHIDGVFNFAYDVTAFVTARQQVQHLNHELTARVQERTRALEAALRLADQHRANLLKQQELLGEILGQVPAAIATLRGPEHHYSFFNAGYQALSGQRTQVGLTVADVFPEVVPQGFLGLLDQVYATGVAFRGQEMPAHLYDPATGRPEQRYVDFIYQPLRDAQGGTQGILAFIVDVTDRVVARQQHAVHQRQLKEAFAQAPVALFVVHGPEYIFDIVNPGMGEMIGYAPDQMLGRRYFDLLPGLAAQGYRALLDQVYQTGQPHVALEQAAQLPHHRDGETGYYTFSYAPLRDADDQVSDIMCIAVDVTEQVRARQQLERLNQQLKRTNVDLDNFIYTASHDLKAPITNIEGLLDTLRHELPQQPPGSEVAFILGLMQGSVERFKRTIEHLTTVSKLQQEHDPSTEQVALAAVLEDVRLDLAPLLQQTGGRLLVHVHNCPLLTLAEKNLRSVVYNLLSNALKYHHPDRPPVVQVRTRLEDAFVVLEVQDNGLGLSAASEQKLFGMFQRLHTHVEGSGLGLYMVKRMVENIGGRITVASRVEEGTTFSVYFPR
ncbi:PAS domain-containing protein [Hymenobacter metallicola]|uniref:histidine kinase n=1 Tax=Hymenobacter metallicola TaxID=2563114 RepID=A0A4Z0Q0P2_9BACT|nr:PAS domain-containing protein [Hymenobacter metallicola]TGE22733.1 PAS domain S-box protein [Hymenobacter metallicola]